MVSLSAVDYERQVLIAALGVSGVGQSINDLRLAYYAAGGGGGGGGGGGTWGSITGTLSAQTDLAAALGAKAPINNPTFTGTVGGLNTDMIADGTTTKGYTAAEQVKLAGVQAGATLNSTDAFLLARANHTGTQSADSIVDGSTNKAYTAIEKTKLLGIATGATANSTDAALLNRANHTGTQSADTLTDGTTNKAFLATERTKLTGIATGATANSTDATLLNRANHTGTQSASTIVGTAITQSGGVIDIDPLGLSGDASDLGGTLPVSVLSANGTIYVAWNGSSWPSAASARTDLRRIYIGAPAASPPSDSQNGDVWFQDNN